MSELATNLLGQWVRDRRTGQSGPVKAVTYDHERGTFAVLFRVRHNRYDYDNAETCTSADFELTREWA